MVNVLTFQSQCPSSLGVCGSDASDDTSCKYIAVKAWSDEGREWDSNEIDRKMTDGWKTQGEARLMSVTSLKKHTQSTRVSSQTVTNLQCGWAKEGGLVAVVTSWQALPPAPIQPGFRWILMKKRCMPVIPWGSAPHGQSKGNKSPGVLLEGGKSITNIVCWCCTTQKCISILLWIDAAGARRHVGPEWKMSSRSRKHTSYLLGEEVSASVDTDRAPTWARFLGCFLWHLIRDRKAFFFHFPQSCDGVTGLLILWLHARHPGSVPVRFIDPPLTSESLSARLSLYLALNFFKTRTHSWICFTAW